MKELRPHRPVDIVIKPHCRATVTEYDMLGRVSRQSVPTEVNGSFEPTGDDLTRGWLWSRQEYDWMGRVVKSIPTDSNGTDGKESLISYEGCGCAGGLVTTVQGPLVPRDDDPQTNARRKQKSYEDILGRAFKAETYEWDGTTVYSTVVNTYNGRDQVTLSRQYAGTALSETYQDTTASYDGHGRTVGQKLPQQDSPGTVFTYNPDGSVLTRTDARGVVTNYEYNNRGLVTGITWDVGSTGVTGTAAVEMEYDNLGNRIEMTDGLGTQAYEYDELSRLTAETRSFTDTLANAPSANNSFRLEYTYHLAGQLKSLKDPYGQQINYSLDRAGKMFSVSGSTSFAGISTYLGTVNYRAWGGVRSITYGNGNTQTTTFDEALRPSGFVLEKDSTAKISRAYEYNKDGSLNYVEDLLNPVFDRLQQYDHQGRLAAAFSGLEARGGTVTDPEDQKTQLPYRQTYGFNAFDNLTSRTNLNWGTDYWAGVSFNRTDTYLNNRKTTTGSSYSYDADGRNSSMVEEQGMSESTYDAAGHLVRQMTGDPNHAPGMTDDIYLSHDGDGRMLKRLQKDYLPLEESWGYHWVDRPLQYYVRSTVLGGAVLSEVNNTGKKLKSYIFAGGQTIAWQAMNHPGQGSPVEMLRFEHNDPAGMSRRMTIENGTATSMEGLESDAAEFDPAGQSVGLWDPYPELPPPFPGEGCIGCGNNGIIGIDDNSAFYVDGRKYQCKVGGIQRDCDYFAEFMYLEGASAPFDHPIVKRYGWSNWVYDRFERSHGERLFVPKKQDRQIDPTPLGGDDMRRWQSERDRLLKMLGWVGDKAKSACRRFLESMGFDVDKIREALANQIPYDAFRSLNDANEDFGIFGVTVKDYFNSWKEQGRIFSGAATGGTGRIYYASTGIVLSVILHETIHATHNGSGERVLYDPTNPKSDPVTGRVSFGPGSALISDSELQDRLGIAKKQDSTNITDELEINGCK